MTGDPGTGCGLWCRAGATFVRPKLTGRHAVRCTNVGLWSAVLIRIGSGGEAQGGRGEAIHGRPALRREQCVAQQAGDRHGTHAPRNGGDRARDLLRLAEADIADEPRPPIAELRGWNAIDADIDHDGTRLDPMPPHNLGVAYCDDEQVCPSADAGYVLRAGMHQRHRRIGRGWLPSPYRLAKRQDMASDDGGEELRPATRKELVEDLSFAIRYKGRKRVNHADADSFMALSRQGGWPTTGTRAGSW